MFGGSPKKTIAMYGMEIISLFDASPLKKCYPIYLLVAPNKHTCAPKPFFQKLTAAPAQQLVTRCHSWQVEPLQA